MILLKEIISFVYVKLNLLCRNEVNRKVKRGKKDQMKFLNQWENSGEIKNEIIEINSMIIVERAMNKKQLQNLPFSIAVM